MGSSILIIYDDTKVGAWLIDFAKTRHVPENVILTHRQPWVPGNHEEGFLFGLDHLIDVSVVIVIIIGARKSLGNRKLFQSFHNSELHCVVRSSDAFNFILNRLFILCFRQLKVYKFPTR